MKSRTTAVSGASDRTKQDALELKYATSIASKISHLPYVSMPNASELYSAIKAAELHSTASALLTTSVDSALEQAADEDFDDKVTAPSQRNQMLLFPLVYMTAALIDSLQSRMSIDTKLLLVAEFLVKLGCTHPHEQTSKRWLCVVLVMHYGDGVMPRYQTIYDYLNKLKQNVRDQRTGKKQQFPRIPMYPKVPSQLAPHIFNLCYEAKYPPIPHTLERYQIFLNHIPLRSNSKLITREKKRKL